MLQSSCTPLVFNRPLTPGEKSCHGARMGVNGLNRTLDGNGSDMTTLTNFVANVIGRKVVDETGLTGNFDFHLDWLPDEADPVPVSPAGADDSSIPIASDVRGVSYFTALQDQLGLELISAKGPVEVIVIDHIEKPDAN